MSEFPSGNVVHTLRGRLRVRVPDKRHDLAYFAKVATELAKCPGVKSIAANALTGSLLIIHDTEDQTIAEYAHNRGLLSMDFSPPPVATITDGERLLGALSSTSRRIAEASGGRNDLTAVLAGAFLVLAVIQLARGQVAVPAVTALWYALEALSLGRHLRSDPKAR